MTGNLFPDLPAAPAADAAPHLWCLHIPGPDDVHPAPSREEAQQAADGFNAWMRARFEKEAQRLTPAQVAASVPLEAVLAQVVPYDGTAAQHAKGVKEWRLTDWLPKGAAA